MSVHCLSTMQISVLGECVATESGRYKELMQKSGLYTKIVKLHTISSECKFKT